MALDKKHERPGLNGVWVGDEFIDDRLSVSLADEEDAVPASDTPYFDLLCDVGNIYEMTPQWYVEQLASGRTTEEIDEEVERTLTYIMRSEITERDLSMFTDEQWDAMAAAAIDEVWGPETVDQMPTE